MLSQAFITQIDGKNIHAMQLVTDACVTCSTGCIQRGKPFLLANRRNFAVQKGSIVRIGRSRFTRGVHGLASLIIPVASAIAGYFLAETIANKIGFESTEAFKAVCILFFLGASAGIVFAISRSSLHFTKPEILQVL